MNACEAGMSGIQAKARALLEENRPSRLSGLSGLSGLCGSLGVGSYLYYKGL
jgi:hypothetical protein